MALLLRLQCVSLRPRSSLWPWVTGAQDCHGVTDSTATTSYRLGRQGLPFLPSKPRPLQLVPGPCVPTCSLQRPPPTGPAGSYISPFS